MYAHHDLLELYNWTKTISIRKSTYLSWANVVELGVIMFLYHCYFLSFHLGRITWRARVRNKLPMTFFCHTGIYISYNVVLFFGGSILKSYKSEVFCYRVLSLVLPKTCYWQSDLTVSWSDVWEWMEFLAVKRIIGNSEFIMLPEQGRKHPCLSNSSPFAFGGYAG